MTELLPIVKLEIRSYMPGSTHNSRAVMVNLFSTECQKVHMERLHACMRTHWGCTLEKANVLVLAHMRV